MKTFLSSTYLDLADYRRAAVDALERLGQQVGRMEVFGARPEEPSQVCLAEIDDCDLMVGIYAHRYGFVPDGTHVSITEAEFDHAKARKKPIFCFMVDEDHPWPPKMIEDEPGRSKLRMFKAKIGSVFVRDTFTTSQDLAYKIATAIGRYLSDRDHDNLLTRLWPVMEPDLQLAFAIAYNQCRREGLKSIKTRYLFAALRRLNHERLNVLLARYPAGLVPDRIDEADTTSGHLLAENPELSGCVGECLTMIGPHASEQRKLTLEDVFVDIALHGVGSTATKMRSQIGADELEDIVEQLGLDVIRRPQSGAKPDAGREPPARSELHGDAAWRRPAQRGR